MVTVAVRASGDLSVGPDVGVQGWPSRAESRSSASRLGDSAKTSASRLGDSGDSALTLGRVVARVVTSRLALRSVLQVCDGGSESRRWPGPGG